MQHHGGQHDHLDRHRGEGQDQRPVGLAVLLGEKLGMSDHADGGVHDDAEDEHEQHLGKRPEVADLSDLGAAGDQLDAPDHHDREHE